MSTPSLPIAVIGAGPVGLAAAAHLLSRGLPVVVLEASGDVAANVRDWGHVRLFSPWRYNIDKAARALLETTGWTAPPDGQLPTGWDLLERYLQPLSRVDAISKALRFGHRVTAITRQHVDKVKTIGREESPFLLRCDTAAGEREIVARAVIDTSGTWATPNPMGANGLPALGEVEARERLAYRIPDATGADRHRYAGKHTLVVGSGHSAANSLLDLAKLAQSVPTTRITWAVRTTDLRRAFGGGDADALAARGALGTALKALHQSGKMTVVTGFRAASVEQSGGTLVIVGVDGRRIETVDEVVVVTGQRPDLSIARELRLKLDPWLECTEALGPLIDPNLHSCGTVRPHGARELAHPESGFFTAGIKSYGRAPTFLMATGYEQVRSIAAFLAGDLAAAAEVQLDLPETGVCSSTLGPEVSSFGERDCCGTPPPPAPKSSCGPSGSCSTPAPVKVVESGCCGVAP